MHARILSALPVRLRTFDWGFWFLLAASAIHVQEWLYRIRFFDSYFSFAAQATLWPTYLAAGVGCFWGFRKAPSFLTAWATFIGFIVVSRVVINWSVGEPWGLEVLSGLGLIAYGLFLTIQGENDARKILFGCAALALVAIAESRRLQFALPLDFEAKPWMLYLFVGALIIAVQENIYRRGQFERYFSWKTLRFVVPLDFVCCGALFYGYRDAEPSFLFGWAVYTFFDVILRVWNNYVLKEPFKATHMLGMLLVIDGAFLTYVGGGR